MPAYAAAGAFRSCGRPAVIEFRLTPGPMLGVAGCLFGAPAARFANCEYLANYGRKIAIISYSVY
jgi:hypothetical protein